MSCITHFSKKQLSLTCRAQHHKSPYSGMWQAVEIIAHIYDV